jgi:hypothetical protein
MNCLKIFSIALATIVLSSCGDNKSQPIPVPQNGNYTGTVTVAPGTADAFTLADTEVKFTLSADKTTADVEMLKVKFAAAMPVSLDVLISGVTLTKTADGYSISGDNIVPTAMGGTPFAQYTITGLTGTVTASSLTLDMMMGTYPMSFEGTAPAGE